MSARNSRITLISCSPSQTGDNSIGPFQRTGASGWSRNSIEAIFMPSGPVGGTAPSAVSVKCWPFRPSIAGTQGPFRSTSRMPTLWPARAKASARFTVTMLLPTPPLPLITRILRLMRPMRVFTWSNWSTICSCTLASSRYFSCERTCFKSFSSAMCAVRWVVGLVCRMVRCVDIERRGLRCAVGPQIGAESVHQLLAQVADRPLFADVGANLLHPLGRFGIALQPFDFILGCVKGVERQLPIAETANPHHGPHHRFVPEGGQQVG